MFSYSYAYIFIDSSLRKRQRTFSLPSTGHKIGIIMKIVMRTQMCHFNYFWLKTCSFKPSRTEATWIYLNQAGFVNCYTRVRELELRIPMGSFQSQRVLGLKSFKFNSLLVPSLRVFICSSIWTTFFRNLYYFSNSDCFFEISPKLLNSVQNWK